jgi:hypothetical protein
MSQPAIPYWARYIAIDFDGDVIAFEHKPVFDDAEGWLTTRRAEVLFTGPKRPDAETTLITLKNTEHGSEKQCRSAL